MTSISNFISLYRQNKSNFGIPEFQRLFTWKDEQIESFFDSILRSYPIPRFFTWRTHEVSAIQMNYFSTNFSVGNRTEAGTPFINDDYENNPITVAICDGQQRLTSLLIGILGYNVGTERSPKYLYFNLFTPDAQIDHCKFKILNDNDASVRKADQFYIKVSDLYNLCHEFRGRPIVHLKNEVINNYYIENGFTPELVDLAKFNIENFRSSINTSCLDFVEINEAVGTDLDKAVQFFMRINNNGSKLTENQILFSLLSRYLQSEGFQGINLRNDFDEITNRYYPNIMKNRGKSYDFFLRCSLYVSTDRVLFKASNFDSQNCLLMLRDWPNLKLSIIAALNLIVELRLEKVIVSLNSIIPIIYHCFKKNNIILSAFEKEQIRIYIIRAQFSKIFGSHGDNLLTHLKSNQSGNYLIQNYQFSFNDINSDLPDGKTFNINEAEIIDLLSLKYNDKKTRPILDLIYSNAADNRRYDVDHFHPQNICKDRNKLIYENVPTGDIRFVMENYDKLPNLQLLKSDCNAGKSDLLISVWIRNVLNRASNGQGDLDCLNGNNSIIEYLRDNKISIPNNYNSAELILDFISVENFRIFYNSRYEYLRSKLIELLCD